MHFCNSKYCFKEVKNHANPGQHYYETQYRERIVNNLKCRAKHMGLVLTPLPSVIHYPN